MASRVIHTVAPNKQLVNIVQQCQVTGDDAKLHPVNCTSGWGTTSGTGDSAPISSSWGRVAAFAATRYGAYNWPIGSYKNVTLNIPAQSGFMSNAISGTYRAVIIGYRHNIEYEDDNCIHFCICQTDTGIPVGFYGSAINTSGTKVGGWAASTIRNWLNTTFYNALPAALRAAIIPITKYSDNKGGSGATYSEADVTPAKEKIWLTTMYEMTGERGMSNLAELTYTKQYPYFFEVDPKIMYRHNDLSTAAEGWSRSPRYKPGNTTDTSMNWCSYTMIATGISHGGHTASYTCAIQPCFAVGSKHTDLIRKQYD